MQCTFHNAVHRLIIVPSCSSTTTLFRKSAIDSFRRFASGREVRKNVPKQRSKFGKSAKKESIKDDIALSNPPAKNVASLSDINEAAQPFYRSATELWKPLAFALGFSGCCYVGATIWHYERHKKLHDYLYNKSRWGYKQREKFNTLREELNKYFTTLTVGEKTVATLIGINALVFLISRRPSMRPFMYRYFTSSFYSKNLYLPMVLSAFSHGGLWHIGLNMYVLWTFNALAIDKLLGLEQFVGFYLSAAVLSSFGSYFLGAIRKTAARSLGASGAILALLTYCCCKYPDARFQIVFLPFFTFDGTAAVIGILAFDIIGLVFRFRTFDHAAHLAGSLFGIWYSVYGEKLLWEKRGPIVKAYLDLLGRKI